MVFHNRQHGKGQISFRSGGQQGSQRVQDRDLVVSTNHFEVKTKNIIIWKVNVDVRFTKGRGRVGGANGANGRQQKAIPVKKRQRLSCINKFMKRRRVRDYFYDAVDSIYFTNAPPIRQNEIITEVVKAIDPMTNKEIECEVILSGLEDWCIQDRLREDRESIQEASLQNLQANQCNFTQNFTKVLLAMIKQYGNSENGILSYGASLYSVNYNQMLGPRSQQISGPLDIWTGYSVNTVINKDKVSISIDMKKTCMIPKQCLVNLVGNYLSYQIHRNGSLPDQSVNKCSRYLKNLKVRGIHNQNIFECIKELTKKNSQEQQVFLKDSEEPITVYDYYKSKGTVLKYPRLQLVNCGTKTKPKFYPLELLETREGQNRVQDLDPNQTRELIGYAAIKPDKRQEQIRKFFDRGQNQVINHDQLNRIGIQIEPTQLKVEPKILEAPQVIYKYYNSKGQREEQPAPVRDGGWNLKDLGFYSCKEIECWHMIGIGFENSNYTLKQFMSFFNQLGNTLWKMGMQIPQKIKNEDISLVGDGNYQQREDILRNVVQKCKRRYGKQPQIIIVVGNEKGINPGLYDEFKKLEQFGPGTSIQYLLGSKSVYQYDQKRILQYCANVGLKINKKLDCKI